jgi:hypothetical protein
LRDGASSIEIMAVSMNTHTLRRSDEMVNIRDMGTLGMLVRRNQVEAVPGAASTAQPPEPPADHLMHKKF